MLIVYEPKLEDLWFRKQLLEDEDTMSYNHSWGGTIPFPKEKWHDWYDYWLIHQDNKRFYSYVQNDEGQFVGEIAYHFDAELNGFIISVIILNKYRNKGYGSSAIDLICDIALKNGISILYDDIAIDNPAIHLFLKKGFKIDYQTDEKIYLKKELLNKE